MIISLILQTLIRQALRRQGVRLLLLDDVGNADATQSPVAWQNTDLSATVASANDIIEWNGSRWNTVFDASAATEVTYTTNLNTSVCNIGSTITNGY